MENQPAVPGDGFVERAIYSFAVDIGFIKRRGAQELQVDGAAVDAGKNAAGGTKLNETPRRLCDTDAKP